jgi:hypothetical protein
MAEGQERYREDCGGIVCSIYVLTSNGQEEQGISWAGQTIAPE